MKNDNFEQSHSAEKSERGDPLGFLNKYYVRKYQKKIEGGTFWYNKKNFEKSLIVPKKSKLKTPR